MAMTVIILAIIILIKPTFTCNPAGQEWEETGTNDVNDEDNGAVDPFFLGALNDSKKWYAHWPDADGMVNGVKYYDWMKEYNAKQKEEEQDYWKKNGKKKMYPDDADSDWPSHWKALGPGMGGVAPPAWAIIKESSGKPDMCYLPPLLGECKSYTIRWGFNPYRDGCAEFIYSGCKGNQNNFYSKKRCVAVCLNPPVSNCIHNRDAELSTFETWIKHLPHGEF